MPNACSNKIAAVPNVSMKSSTDGGIETVLEDGERELIAALANRAYHLPGYGYWADLRQYLNNNHPLLGICFRHPLHPIKTGYRLLILVSSGLFGLAVSSVFYLVVLSDERFQKVAFVIPLGGGGEDSMEYPVTSGMLMLVFVGGSFHAAYDLGVWYILSCGCCPMNFKCQQYGKYTAVLLVGLLSVTTTLLVLLRISLEQEENQEIEVLDLGSIGLVDDAVELISKDIHGDDVQFLVAYISAFALALLVYYPMGSFVLFSGVLGCCKLPILGGRSREVQLEKKRIERGRRNLGDNNI